MIYYSWTHAHLLYLSLKKSSLCSTKVLEEWLKKPYANTCLLVNSLGWIVPVPSVNSVTLYDTFSEECRDEHCFLDLLVALIS